MAHFAELDKNNIVLRVIVVDNINCIKESVRMAQPTLTQSSLKSISGNIVSVNKAGTSEKENIDWEDETVGIVYCKSIFGVNTIWIQTSYSGGIRKNYAGIGYIYDSKRDAFIPPQQYKSWVLDEVTCQWEPPVKYPNDGRIYNWNEDKLVWEIVK